MRSHCNRPGCPDPATKRGYCAQHAKAEADAYEAARPSAKERGYGKRWKGIRRTILKRDPFCVCDGDPDETGRARCYHGGRPECMTPSHVVDHYPLSRRERVARGLAPDALDGLRGLCDRCHRHWTGRLQGWRKGPAYPSR